MKQYLQPGFGVFFDPTKTTSGQRFFSDLHRALSSEALNLDQRPAVVLFNVSAPWKFILKAKFNRQKVVLRVDGLYNDRLSPEFLRNFGWPLRLILAFGLRFHRAHDRLASLANFCNQNYGAFLRIIFADWIIYQSEFSRYVHQRYFPNKPYSVIVNGSIWHKRDHDEPKSKVSDVIQLVTIYDEWKPAKRISDLVSFVQWANETKKIAVRLTIVGYTGKTPIGARDDLKQVIETSPVIRTLPRFKAFGREVTNALSDSDIYLSFSYRDPCPNVVVEAMAHGLPIVAVGSGGLPDIVGSAGILLPIDDFESGYFAAHRWEYAFPPIDYESVLKSLTTVKNDYNNYRLLVQERFDTHLDITIVAERYARVLRSLVIQG